MHTKQFLYERFQSQLLPYSALTAQWKCALIWLCYTFSTVIVLIACFVIFCEWRKMFFFVISFNSYLRSQKSYTPPSDISDKVNLILSSSNVTDKSKKLEMAEKFNILKAFNDTFDHSVPNSQLHEISSIGKFFLHYHKRLWSLYKCLPIFITRWHYPLLQHRSEYNITIRCNAKYGSTE